MTRGLLTLLIAAVVLPACEGCEGCPSEEPGADVRTEEVSSEPRITQINRRHAGEPLSAVAVHPDGRVALFGHSRAFAITQILHPSEEDPPTAMTMSRVMDAGWIDDHLVGLETDPTALVLWADSEERSRVALDGTAVDLLVDAENTAAWVVSRTDGGAVVYAYSVGPDGLQLRLTHTLGAQPVGLWSGYGSVYAPTFLDRTITEFSASEFTWRGSIPVRERPLAIHPTQEGPAVIGANAAVVQIVKPDAHRFIEMPPPQWIVEERGNTYAFAAGDSVLRRLDGLTFELEAENTSLGLVRGVASSEFGLVVIDAGHDPQIVVLDPLTLEPIVSAQVEGRPDQIVAVASGALVVISPAEGVVASYEVSER